PRPPAPKAGALTGLRYTPKLSFQLVNFKCVVVSQLRVQRYALFPIIQTICSKFVEKISTFFLLIIQTSET
ncbi:MAG TPA: hypothetical protein VFC36_08285, partial [Paludibacter sp.]|nr:hypothetical protein [Paludibacter sp.]